MPTTTASLGKVSGGPTPSQETREPPLRLPSDFPRRLKKPSKYEWHFMDVVTRWRETDIGSSLHSFTPQHSLIYHPLRILNELPEDNTKKLVPS